MKKRGVLYIAFGEKWRKETIKSIKSLKKVSPNIKVAVVTDSVWDDAPLPDEFIVREELENKGGITRSKTAYMRESPFEETLFLDTDTIVSEDISEIFGLLQYYDFGVYFRGPILREEKGLYFHPQCNSGVILFKMNQKVVELFDIWESHYEKTRLEALKNKTISDDHGIRDQRQLAIAIAKSSVRVVSLDVSMNFHIIDNILTYSPPKIYHGRIENMDLLHNEVTCDWNIDKDWQGRLWIPSIQGFFPRGIRQSNPLLALALVLMRYFNIKKRRNNNKKTS